jgi:hypothetical protein
MNSKFLPESAALKIWVKNFHSMGKLVRFGIGDYIYHHTKMAKLTNKVREIIYDIVSWS